MQCIGCGMCVRACPKTFQIEDSWYARARVVDQAGDSPEDIDMAIDVCPISCIFKVGVRMCEGT